MDRTSKSRAVWVKVHMFASRSGLPVSKVSVSSTGPTTAKQAWPAASPVAVAGRSGCAGSHSAPRWSRNAPAPDGQAAAHIPSVLARIPSSASSGMASSDRRASWV